MSKTGYNEAAALSRSAHAGQVDRAGNDYFTAHVEEVVRIVREELGGSISDAVVAYLHDVVEDSPVTIEEIEAKFGAEVAGHVAAVTRNEGEMYFEFIERAIAHGGSAKTVKTADVLDHLHNGNPIPFSLTERYAKALTMLMS